MIMSSKLIQCGLAILLLLVRLSLPAPITTPIQATTDPSESTTTTTQSMPRIPRETSSGAAESIPSCCDQRQSSTCTSLQEAIYNMFRITDPDADRPYNVFTLKDLYYSGLLNGSDIGDELDGSLQPPPLGANFATPLEQGIATRNCEHLMNNLEFPTQDATGSCSWTYSCTQNQAEFPSFHVEAELVSPQPFHGTCVPVVIRDRRFLRTVCDQDNSLPHWVQCDCGEEIVGFRYEADGE